MHGRIEGLLLHQLYSGLGTGAYLLLLLLRPLVETLGGRLAYGFSQRLGRYPRQVPVDRSACRIVWVHASSVGEVQAAIVLVTKLLSDISGLRIVVTSTTEQGNRLARSRMPADVSCLMAPLDLPQAVRRALRTLRPDCYICLETELWPVMLAQVQSEKVPALLLNGRLSRRSFDRYKHIRGYMASLLAAFRTVAVISEADGRRYEALGVPAERIQVCGNLKYDMPAQSPDKVRLTSRRRLCVTSERVFLCGSTHEGEEAQLLNVFRALARQSPTVWVIAPRHLERLPAVEAFLLRSGTTFDRFSTLAKCGRRTRVIVVDSMGDLADLYAGGDYIFCGGSLVDRGGHNILEAARWGRPVYFGPHMKDFRDAAEMLIQAGGGFQVADAEALADLVLSHADKSGDYALACTRAAEVAARQRGAVARQADIVRQMLKSC
jgi:3-deoxy-D-manno-octulosonic-acid transferase